MKREEMKENKEREEERGNEEIRATWTKKEGEEEIENKCGEEGVSLT